MKRKTNFRKFNPVNPAAKAQVQQLLDRGGVLLFVDEWVVKILREQSVAVIDTSGRVTWSQATRADIQSAIGSGG